MSGLENLKQRLNYRGGNAEGRFQEDKLKTLKKALLYSYQAATAILSDGREFRCLINTDKTKADYDVKILSIPYEDICLGRIVEKINDNGEIEKIEIKKEPNKEKTSKGIEKIGIKPGDVFEWKETQTYWLVYLEKLEEDSYFRGEIYKCEEEIEINNKKYHIYIRGPVETTIQWNLKKGSIWNDINYSLIVYITKDDNTLSYFHRFSKVKIGGKAWEVKTVDPYSADGIIEICLGEWFENDMQENIKKEENKIYKNNNNPYIEGSNVVSPFDLCEYSIKNLNGGEWRVSNCNKAKILKSDENNVLIEIITGKSGKFDLIYFNKKENKEAILHIDIKSL